MNTPKKQLTAWNAMVGGIRLIFKQQRVLWWLFLVNFGLGVIAVLPVRLALGDGLDHSLASSALTDHFDVAAYAEVVSSPRFNFGTLAAFSILTAVVFAMIALFAEAGVIQEFRQAAGVNAPPRKQTAADFFGACGLFYGRMIRLLLWSLLPLSLLVLSRFVLTKASNLIADRSSSEVTVMQLSAFSGLLFLLLFTAVRVWIIMAEIHTVAGGQRSTRRIFLKESRKLVIRNFRTLYVIQLVTTVLGLIVMLLGLAVWIKFVPPPHVFAAFLVSELTLLIVLGCRLWQRASLVMWYECHRAELESKTAELSISQLKQYLSPVLTMDLTRLRNYREFLGRLENRSDQATRISGPTTRGVWEIGVILLIVTFIAA